MRASTSICRSFRGINILFGLVAVVGAPGCAVDPNDDSDLESADTAQDDLTQGVDKSNLWHSKTVSYCFERPLLQNMPSSVRAKVSTQAALDSRWAARRAEFISAINSTWQAVGVLNLVAKVGCSSSGGGHVRYSTNTPTGGYASMGRTGSIDMDAEFLGDTYPKGLNTYHTYTAAHEFGHLLGFRHEQDRKDSTCHDSQDSTGVGIPLGAYDPNSIMNYCNSQKTVLTTLDKQGFRKAYSFL